MYPSQPFFEVLSQATGLEPETVKDLLTKGWSLTVSLDGPPTWQQIR